MLDTIQQPKNPKTISASEAQNKFGAVVSWVLDNQREVVIESRGEPKIVMMPFDRYEETQQMREQKRRAEALAKLRQLRNRVSARFKDLSQEEIDRFADEVSRDAVRSLVKKGVIRFENDN
jgi:prevent-host-death family protein